MSHNLFLGMYTFGIKKYGGHNRDLVELNNFLSVAYPDAENKFLDGFVQDVIELLDEKVFKNIKNTHGGTLDNKAVYGNRRILDIMIDGGITGVQQFLIKEDGEKEVLNKGNIVGPKFFGRIWLPSNSKTGYLFIQKYGSISIKPLFDDIIRNVLVKHDFNIVNSNLRPTTTQARMKQFLKKSTIKDITIVSRQSSFSTGTADANSATITLKRFKSSKGKQIDAEDINAALKNHGFSIEGRDYDIKATYEHKTESVKEVRTVSLDTSEETINVIPNIIVPPPCIDIDNYPIFEQMQEFVDKEIEQVKKESKR